MVKEIFTAKPLINVNGKIMDLSSPKVMGIVNATPDSFYSESRSKGNDVERKVADMIHEGADIIDIGGYSSRPGADVVSLQEELDRVIPLIETVSKAFQIPISIDTFRSEVARLSVEAGAAMINDISGGELDDRMFQVVADLQVPYIMMHMRGNPGTMQKDTNYEDLISDLIRYFERKLHRLNQMGVKDIIIDPGFGFAKTLDQNYEILKKLDNFTVLERPLLVGVSRKSMIFKYLEVGPEDSLNGTSILNTVALQGGASILRVHDVKEAVEAIRIIQKLRQ